MMINTDDDNQYKCISQISIKCFNTNARLSHELDEIAM